MEHLRLAKLYAARFASGEKDRKNRVWQVLCRYFFQKYIVPADTVLDLGAGYCEFINHIACRRRIAFDLNEQVRSHAGPGVEVVLGVSTDLSAFQSEVIDVVFASNFFEHLVFASFFLLVGLWPLLRGQTFALATAALFLLLALARPKTLAPLNRVWTTVGLLLHRVISPLVMAAIFYTTVTPIGLALRLVGKDPVRLRFDPEATTYWIERRPPGPTPDTMTNQF